MKHAITFAALFALSSSVCNAQTAPELFQLSVKDAPAENGKKLQMAFQEIGRDAESSTVEIEFVSGGSVSSSMFILRGMCGLARVRGEQFFHSAQVSRNPTRFRVTFPKAASSSDLKPANALDKVFSEAECSLLKF